ncbi:MAG: hypothetical protein JNK82_09450 [Myxococcaceae bacterium]|nr:hypothetical protein [Myxococcaceae bacterium]
MRAAAASFLLCACTLARLPDASFPCSVDADCLSGACVAGTCRGTPSDAGQPDSGAVDAGAVDAGAVDAGAVDSGAVDAGVPDAGAPDSGTADAGEADAGFDAGAEPLFCETWACAASGFTPWDGGLDGGYELDEAPCAEFSGGQPWFGAVLAPSGNVVGIPKGARQPLRVNSKSLACATFGKPRLEDAGTWVSGVLGRDGLIYAAPNTAHRILQIDEREDAGDDVLFEWGPELFRNGQPPGFLGAVLDSRGDIWMVSALGHGIARVTGDGGAVQWFATSGPSNFWGVARVESAGQELLVAVPQDGFGAVYVATPADERFFPASGPYQGQPSLFGVHATAEGSLVSAGLNAQIVAHLQPLPDAGIAVDGLDAGGLSIGFRATGPHGDVWAMPHYSQAQVTRITPKGPTVFPVTFSAPGYSTCAVIATEYGIVGLPCELNDRVLRLRFSSGERRNLQQLLSPFFNKL